MDEPARRFTVGRDKGCDVAIADDSVSRIHAELAVLPDGRVMLTDNHSRNGTAVIRNGRREPVDRACVSPNDEVQFGDVVFRVNDLLGSLGNKLPAAAAKAGSLPAPAGLDFEALISLMRRRWRESLIAAMLLAALILLAINEQSQTARFIVGIMGSVIAGLLLSILQQYWTRK